MSRCNTLLGMMEAIAIKSNFRLVHIEKNSPMNIRHYEYPYGYGTCNETVADPATYAAYRRAVDASKDDWEYLGQVEDESNYCIVDRWMHKNFGDIVFIRILPSLLGIDKIWLDF